MKNNAQILQALFTTSLFALKQWFSHHFALNSEKLSKLYNPLKF